MPLLTDAALDAEVTAAIAGDRDAFARLVAATSSLVTAITLSETRDVELARDAAQDVYLQVWAGLGGLRQPGSFLPWLRTAARRQARRLSLQRTRRARGAEADAALEQAVDAGPGPGERLLDAERASLVRSALEALPDEARETLILYYREGHSSAQVGRLLGLSDAAVQQRLSRARSKVREEILARLGEALERSAPAAGFTAAVVALLLPRTAAAAGAQAVGGLLAALQVPKVLVAGGVAVLALLGLLFTFGPRGPGGGGPPTVTIARPAGERPLSEPARETPRAETTTPVAEGALEPRVTAAGAPVAGAALRIYSYVQADAGTARPAWRLLATAVAGPDGSARVPASPGAYLVAARAPGFAAAQVKVVRPGGELVTRVEVSLDPAVTLAGRTIDRSGQLVPLAALVMVRAAERGAPNAEPPPEERLYATSDARGAFRVEGLAPGRWQLTAEAAGHARTVVERLSLPRTSPLDVVLGSSAVIDGMVVTAEGKPARGAEVRFAGGPELVQVESGASGGFAAEVTPGSFRVSAVRGDETGWVERSVQVGPGAQAHGLVIRLGMGARFTGRVVNDAGAPVGGAQILLTPFDAFGELARLVSAADGSFRSAPLAPGEYDLDATAAGLSSTAARGLVLLPGQRFELTLTLRETGRIVGQVRGSSGEPLPSLRVSGGLAWGSTYGEIKAEAVTDADGRFRATLPAGTWKAMCWHPAAAVMSKGWPAVNVVAGASVPLELVLERKEKDQVTLRLTILEPDGAPAGLARYQLFAPPGTGMVSMANDEGIAEPSMTFPGRDMARLLVSARKGGRRAVQVEIPPGAREATIQLQPAARLTGTLETGGAPVTSFKLRVEYAPVPPLKYADEEERRFSGSAFLLADAPPGDATVIATTDDGRSAKATVQLRPGETTELKLTVARSGTLRVRLLDATGKPETGAYVMVGGKMIDASPDGFDFDPDRVKDGALVAPDLPPGPVELELGARCFEPQHRAVTIQAGETLDLGDVTLKPLPPAACGR